MKTRKTIPRLLAALALPLGSVTMDASLAERMTYAGASDASAVVMLDDRYFVVADDEENVLRLYDRLQPGSPVRSFGLSSFLNVDPRSPESDLEGGARVGDRIFWITSHGRNKGAQLRPSRQRLFATQIVQRYGMFALEPVGSPYLNLHSDLLRDPRLHPFGLSAASTRAPKAEDAFNIEGLAAAPNGQLLIGFRNPIPQGRALVVPLLNPGQIIAGEAARLGDPILLDLDGLGIRSLTWANDRYLIIAGSYDGSGPSWLYEWGGQATVPPRRLTHINFAGLNPEGLDAFSEGGIQRLLIVSDDGALKVGPRQNKRLRKPVNRTFQVLIIDP